MAERVHPSDFTPNPPTPPPETASPPPDAGDTSPFLRRPPPGTYVIQIPKDQVLSVPPPDRARKAKLFARRPVRRRRLRRCCCCMVASLLLAAIALAAAAGIVYLIFRPKAPSYSVTSLSISGLDPSLSSGLSPISPRVNATVRAENRNKRISILYQSGGSVSLSFDSSYLCSGDWPAFRQGPQNVTEFKTELAGNGILLTSATYNKLVTAKNNGTVPLTMNGKIPVKIKFGALTTWKITVKVNCDLTVDGLGANATVKSKSCKAKSHYLW